MRIMPPHCDSLDGAVLAAAIETGSAEPVMDFLSDELKGQLGRDLMSHRWRQEGTICAGCPTLR